MQTTTAILLVLFFSFAQGKRIHVEVTGKISCSASGASNKFAMLELFLDRAQKAAVYFDGKYGKMEIGGDAEFSEAALKPITPRIKVTHSCFENKKEVSFIIALDPTTKNITIHLHSIELYNVTSYAVTMINASH